MKASEEMSQSLRRQQQNAEERARVAKAKQEEA